MAEADGGQVRPSAPIRRDVELVGRPIDVGRVPVSARRPSLPKAGPVAVTKTTVTPLERQGRRQVSWAPLRGLATAPSSRPPP